MSWTTPTDIFAQLQKNELFQKWQKLNPQNYLTHLFCPLSADLNPKAEWEVGFFNPKTEKITVFAPLKNDFEIKPEDEVFQKEKVKLEELELNKIKVHLEKALEIWKEQAAKLFPKEKTGDGFLILQRFEKKDLWNFTFITTSLKFVNLKINAEKGGIESHQILDLIDREKKK